MFVHDGVNISHCFCPQKQQKYSENKLKALKARNDYLLCIEAANAAISKYFSDDISDLMDVSTLPGFYQHTSLTAI